MNLKRIVVTAGAAFALGCGVAPTTFAASVYPPDTTTPASVAPPTVPNIPTDPVETQVSPGPLPTTGSSSTGLALQLGAGTMVVGLVAMTASRRRRTA